MNDNENLVLNDTENVEQTTEETTEQVTQSEPAVKTYTEEEVNQIVGKRLARQNAKIRKEYEDKYGQLETVLKTGTGKDDVTEITDTFRDFYSKKGIQMPTKPQYSDRDVAILAEAEAKDIIEAGFDEVVSEVDSLAAKGYENMTAREKALFSTLATYRQREERSKELSKIGVTPDVYNSAEFQDFAKKFNSGTPIAEIYNIYASTQPKKNIQTMGSMKGGQESKVKDYYTPEEIARLTDADLDNDEVWNAVRRSMTGKA